MRKLCHVLVWGLLFILVFCPAKGYSEEGFIFDDFMRQNLPGGLFYPSFMENYAPDITSLTEESNGFSLLDSPRLYFEGDSFVHFHWYVDDVNIDSALTPGSPALDLPFSAVSAFSLHGEQPGSGGYGFHFQSGALTGNSSRLILSTVYPDLGGYSTWLNFLHQTPATDRADRLYASRRKILDNFFIDGRWGKTFSSSSLVLALQYLSLTRQFNDFNTRDKTFAEDGQTLVGYARFQKELTRGHYRLFGVFNVKERDRGLAELGVLPQETEKQQRYAFLAGFGLEKEKYRLTMAWQQEREERQPFTDVLGNFPGKDLKDNDGDGFFIPNRYGEFTANVLSANLQVPFHFSLLEKSGNGNAFIDFRKAIRQGDETTVSPYPLFFDQGAYLFIDQEAGQAYRHTNTHLMAGLQFSWNIAPRLDLVSKIFFLSSALRFENEENNLALAAPGIDLGLEWRSRGKTRILLAFGAMPYEVEENVNDFLETGRPGGSVYHWNDLDDDRFVDNGEKGALFASTGSRYHSLDQDLVSPMKYRLLATLSTPIGKKWLFNVKGIIKQVKNNFTVRFPEEYGFYQEANGYSLYFFNRPIQEYRLTNDRYSKNPLYAQLLLNITGGQPGQWFFNFSFLSHIGMGVTAFGNGPGTNDIGIIDESMANPNSWLNGYGRLDGDRGFMAKLFYAFYPVKDLSLGIGFKYRDGDPFAFIESLYAHDQWVLYYATIKAEDEHGKKGGPREDYLGDLSIQVTYRFRLFNRDIQLSLALFNILDVGYELSEYVFSGGSRDAMELNIMRSLRLTLSIPL